MIIANSQFIILMVLVAIASGLLGVFAMMRKMTLAADALSHVALPGLGLALMIKIDPIIGGAVALFFGAILIWFLERKTEIPTETVIGVIFSASLALGSLLASGEELIDALFGGAGSVGNIQFVVGISAALLVIFFILSQKEKLILALVSKDLAVTSGVNVSRLDFLFLIIFALNIILGLQFLGVLLMGSLIIVPAAISRNLASSLNGALLVSVFSAVISVLVGFFISQTYGWALGPIIITVATGLFLLSLLVRRVD